MPASPAALTRPIVAGTTNQRRHPHSGANRTRASSLVEPGRGFSSIRVSFHESPCKRAGNSPSADAETADYIEPSRDD